MMSHDTIPTLHRSTIATVNMAVYSKQNQKNKMDYRRVRYTFYHLFNNHRTRSLEHGH